LVDGEYETTLVQKKEYRISMFLKLFSQKRKMFAYTLDFGLVMLNTKSDDDSKKGQFLQNHCKFLPSFIRHHKYADPLYIIVLQLFTPIYHASDELNNMTRGKRR
jgi:hypothetical protein